MIEKCSYFILIVCVVQKSRAEFDIHSKIKDLDEYIYNYGSNVSARNSQVSEEALSDLEKIGNELYISRSTAITSKIDLIKEQINFLSRDTNQCGLSYIDELNTIAKEGLGTLDYYVKKHILIGAAFNKQFKQLSSSIIDTISDVTKPIKNCTKTKKGIQEACYYQELIKFREDLQKIDNDVNHDRETAVNFFRTNKHVLIDSATATYTKIMASIEHIVGIITLCIQGYNLTRYSSLWR